MSQRRREVDDGGFVVIWFVGEEKIGGEGWQKSWGLLWRKRKKFWRRRKNASSARFFFSFPLFFFFILCLDFWECERWMQRLLSSFQLVQHVLIYTLTLGFYHFHYSNFTPLYFILIKHIKIISVTLLLLFWLFHFKKTEQKRNRIG